MLVFHDTFELAPANADVISVVGGGPMFQRELRASQIEIITPVCGNAGEVMRHLVAARRQLVDATRGSIRLLAAGTHPLSSDSGEISAGERYRQIEDEYAWAVRRSLVCGLHVHVAVGEADRALAVFNALRSYLPEIAAISANSPFLDGEDTGLCSIRPKLSEALPRTGVPPEFASWEPFVAYVGWGRRGGLFPDASFLVVGSAPSSRTWNARATGCGLPDAGRGCGRDRWRSSIASWCGWESVMLTERRYPCIRRTGLQRIRGGLSATASPGSWSTYRAVGESRRARESRGSSTGSKKRGGASVAWTSLPASVS